MDLSGDGPWYPKDVTFIFPYAGLFFLTGYHRPYGFCKVRIKKDSGGIHHVRVYEPEDTGTVSVTNWIENIATGLYWTFLRGEDVRTITWTIHYEKQPGVTEPHDWPVQLYWDGTQFQYGRPASEIPEPRGFWARLFGKDPSPKDEGGKPFALSPDAAPGLDHWTIWQEPGSPSKGGA